MAENDWAVEFFEEEERCPVREFLEDLEVPHRAKLLAVIKLLGELGPTLPFPYSSQVEGKLRELRTHYGETHYRVFYFGHPTRSFVLVHAFVKRTDRTPRREIDIARERMRRSLERAAAREKRKKR